MQIKMANILTIKERILQIAKYKGLTNEIFCDKIDISYANLKGKAKTTPINSNSLANILAFSPEINIEWLLTGHGAMLKPAENPANPPPEVENSAHIYKEIIKEQKEEIRELNREVGKLQEQISFLKNEIAHHTRCRLAAPELELEK